MDTLLNTTLGGYTLKRLLGSGGMGSVYLAEDPTIGQQVAIKIVRTVDDEYGDSFSQEQATERFRQEARAVASLDHLHILPLYRYGEEETPSGRQAYMVMQYRPEGSLWDWLKKRAGVVGNSQPIVLPQGLPTVWPLSATEIDDYLHQAATALQYAHDRGIIHRDIKPANFLLRFDANPGSSATPKVFLLLSDFGLAKFYAANSANSRVFGTPTYMSPEQFEGNARPESDQYALAVMIFGMLAGKPPFEGDPIRLMHQHLTLPPPAISTYVPELSTHVDQVFQRALAKQPAQRYPSIMAFADAFSQAIQEPANVANKSMFRSPLPQARLLSTDHNSLPAQQPFAGQFQQPPVVSSSSPSLNEAQTEYVAPTEFASGTVHMHNPGAQETPTHLQHTPSDPDLDPTIISAPANRTQQPGITNQPGSMSTVYQQQTPPPALVSPVQQPVNKKVSRRGALGWIIGGTAIVALGAGAGIWFAERSMQAGTHSKPILTLTGHSGTVNNLAWSPDGVTLCSCSSDNTARLWNIATRKETQVYQGHSQPVRSIAWNADGSQVASGSEDYTVQVWDRSGTLLNGPFNLLATVTGLAWNALNTGIFASTLGEGLREIALLTNHVSIARIKSFLSAMALSPDGRYLALGTKSGYVDVYTIADFKQVSNHFSHKGEVLALAWSPDGTQLASGGADRQVQILNITNDTLAQPLVHAESITSLSWSPTHAGQLASLTHGGHAYIWSAGQKINDLYSTTHGLMSTLAWSKNGLATGTSKGPILLWNV